MALHGHLDIECALDARGWSTIQRQSFSAPMHISKPHRCGDTLVLNVVNPTAGLLSGDRITSRVHVGPGARLLVTSPSASRSHTMACGRAELDQHFTVEAGGWLESLPEILIPQAQTSYLQTTIARALPSSDMLLWEMVAPGRVASGESWLFRELSWHTHVWVGDDLVAREDYTLRPGDPPALALRRLFCDAYYASCIVVTRRLTDASECWDRIHHLHSSDCWVGSGALAHGAGWAIRIIGSGSIVVRQTVAAIRRELHAAMGRTEPSLRRSGGFS